MIAGALFYYQYNTVKNRLLARVKRLREPKYLVGAIVGGMYFYFYLLRAFFRGTITVGSPVRLEMLQSFGALFLMVAVLLAWVVPHSRSALAFTEAEAAFLFPAPISRLTLINFKLLKSQFAILFSSLLMTIVGRGFGSGHFIIRAFGWWALLSVFNLHLLGSSFALTMLMDRGISNWQRRAIFLGVVAVALVGVYFWVRATLPPLPVLVDGRDPAHLMDYGRQILRSGPIPWLLFPFRLMIAPYCATNFPQFFTALGPALLIIGLHYLWVTRSNVAFEEASLDRSRKDADRLAAVRSGNWRGIKQFKKGVRPPFELQPLGNPAVAVFWKNLVSAGQYVTARVWLILFWCVFGAAGILRSKGNNGVDFRFIILVFTGMLALLSIISGPQMLRNDLRQDLLAADLLKTYPMPGWLIILGEVLAPAVMLAALQWVLIVLALVICPDHLFKTPLLLSIRLSIAASAAIVFPLIDFVVMLIPNASVLFFPAWFQLGKEGPRGFETSGQQIILMFGQLLVLIISMLPAAIAFGALFFGVSFLVGPSAGLVSGAIAAAAALAGETALGIYFLGGLFERLDVSSENL